MRAPLPASLRLPRRSPCWPPHRQPSITPAPATPVDTEPTAPAPTSPTSRAHHPTAATAQQVHSPDKNTEQHITYLRHTPLGKNVTARSSVGPTSKLRQRKMWLNRFLRGFPPANDLMWGRGTM